MQKEPADRPMQCSRLAAFGILSRKTSSKASSLQGHLRPSVSGASTQAISIVLVLFSCAVVLVALDVVDSAPVVASTVVTCVVASRVLLCVVALVVGSVVGVVVGASVVAAVAAVVDGSAVLAASIGGVHCVVVGVVVHRVLVHRVVVHWVLVHWVVVHRVVVRVVAVTVEVGTVVVMEVPVSVVKLLLVVVVPSSHATWKWQYSEVSPKSRSGSPTQLFPKG